MRINVNKAGETVDLKVWVEAGQASSYNSMERHITRGIRRELYRLIEEACSVDFPTRRAWGTMDEYLDDRFNEDQRNSSH